MGSMCVIAPWPRSWPHTRLLWRSRLVRASSVVLSGCAVACVACCRVEVCRVVWDVLPVRRMGAVTCFCVLPRVGSGCRVVFSSRGWVRGVLPVPGQALGDAALQRSAPFWVPGWDSGDRVPKHGRSWAQTHPPAGGSGRGDPRGAEPCWGCSGPAGGHGAAEIPWTSEPTPP